jgi:hypothetical protein
VEEPEGDRVVSSLAWFPLDMFLTDVYERLTKKGEKAGFLQLLATQVTSAVWHVRSSPCPHILLLADVK